MGDILSWTQSIIIVLTRALSKIWWDRHFQVHSFMSSSVLARKDLKGVCKDCKFIIWRECVYVIYVTYADIFTQILFTYYTDITRHIGGHILSRTKLFLEGQRRKHRRPSSSTNQPHEVTPGTPGTSPTSAVEMDVAEVSETGGFGEGDVWIVGGTVCLHKVTWQGLNLDFQSHFPSFHV